MTAGSVTEPNVSCHQTASHMMHELIVNVIDISLWDGIQLNR
jgi:hypothetical protein